MMRALLLLVVFVNVVNGKCPYKCYCTRSSVYCHDLRRFPDFSSMPTWTVNISIYQLDIPEIPAAAFRNLPNVKTISIYEGSIGQIHSCAFQGLRNVDKIELFKVNIKSIEMYAFSDIRNVKVFTLYKSWINNINSYAFYNMKNVKLFSLHTLNVKEVKSHSFYSVGAVDAFYLYGSNITTIRRKAFARSSFKTVYVFYNYMANLECQTIDVLKNEATEDFHFYYNDLECGCQLAWLVQPNKKSLLADSHGPVKCAGPSKSQKDPNGIQITAADLNCPAYRLTAKSRSCPPAVVPTPARTRARQCLKRY